MALDLRDIEKAAREQGWRVERTGRGHWRFFPPDPSKLICTFSGTPGDVKAIRNFLAASKRQGLIWPWPPQGGKKR